MIIQTATGINEEITPYTLDLVKIHNKMGNNSKNVKAMTGRRK